MNKQELLQVLKTADLTANMAYRGSAEGFEANPEFKVVQHENPMDDSSKVEKSWILPELCGFASLRCGGRDPIVRLIKKYGKPEYRPQNWYEVEAGREPELTGYEFNGWSAGKSYGGGYTIILPSERKWGQGMVSKERGLHAAIPLLKELGSFWVWTHLD